MGQSDNFRDSVSAFMDGELPQQEGDSVAIACGTNTALDADWSLYHCIGDVLRSNELACHSPEFCARFASRLESEPHIFAPLASRMRSSKPARRRTPAFAAASVAAIVVIAGLVWSAGDRQSAQLARAPAATMPDERLESVATPMIRVSREYLAAHDQYSSGLAMNGLVSHVRNVGAGNGK